MSIKGTRPVKNLTTLIECSENGEDSTSLMLASEDPNAVCSLNDTSSSKLSGAEDSAPENSVPNDIQSSSKHVRNSSDTTVKSRRSDTSSKNSRRKRSSALSADSSNDLSPEYGPSSSVRIFQQKEPSQNVQKSFSFRAILNSVTAPVRRSKQEKLSQSKDSAPLTTTDDSQPDQCLPRKIDLIETKENMDEINKTETENSRQFTSDMVQIPLNIHHFRKKYVESVLNTMRDENSKSQEIEEYVECQVCFSLRSLTQFPTLINCPHRPCRTCLELYLKIEIMENRINVCCPECSESLHPNDIYSILCMTNPQLLINYERFMIRAVLIKEADTRWCPGQDCDYAVVANSCAACPKLECERTECGTLFCYHCKGEWHANQTCDEARGKSMDRMFASATTNGLNRSGSLSEIIGAASSSTNEPFKPSDLKACPRCRTLILKLQDGSCNHMVCPMCQADFCWLCLKEISDLHYLSPTGCTFWGKKPWTRKKKLMWQIGTLIGAPVGIALIAGLAVPGIICGVPVFVGRKIHQRFANSSKTRRRLLTAAGVTGSLIFSPFLAVLAVGVGVPIMLAYTYGVVPLSLCRNGGCGGSNESTSLEIFAEDEEEGNVANELRVYDNEEQSRLLRKRLSDIEKMDQTSMATHVSTNSAFSLNGPSTSAARGNHGHATQADVLSSSSAKINLMVEQRKRKMSAESYATVLGDKINFESASTKAQAGSHYHFDNKSVHTVCSGNSEVQSYCCENEESSSIKPMSGSIDGKSLGDSSSLRFVRQHRANSRPERDLSPSSVYSLNEQQTRLSTQRLATNQCVATSSNLLPNSSNGQADLTEVTNENVGSTDNRDPFRVQSLLDNLRQILNDDKNEQTSNGQTKAHKKRIPNASKQGKKTVPNSAGSRLRLQYEFNMRALSLEMPISAPVESFLTPSGTVLTTDNKNATSDTVKGKNRRRRFVSFFRPFRNNNDEPSSA